MYQLTSDYEFYWTVIHSVLAGLSFTYIFFTLLATYFDKKAREKYFTDPIQLTQIVYSIKDVVKLQTEVKIPRESQYRDLRAKEHAKENAIRQLLDVTKPFIIEEDVTQPFDYNQIVRYKLNVVKEKE